MSKQFILLAILTTYGILASFIFMPFVGLALYIEFAVLRPQYIWKYQMFGSPNVPWSFYLALATIGATVLDTLMFGRRTTYKPGDFAPAPTKITWGHACFYLFALWILLANWTAVDPNLSTAQDVVKEAGATARDSANDEYFKVYIMCTVMWWVMRSAKQAWLIVLIFANGIGYIAFDVNMRYLFDGKLQIQSDGYGGLDNNGAAILLAIGIPPCIFAWEKYRGIYRWGFLAFVPVILHAVMLTFSRGALLTIIVSSPFLILRGPQRRMKIILALCAMPGVLYMAGAEVQNRFASTGDYSADASAQSRFDSWKAALKMAADQPLFGWGTRNSPLFIKEYGGDIEGRAVHNQYLQVAADNGFIGAGFYIGAIFFALLGYQRVIRRTRHDPHPEAQRLLMTAYAMQTSLIMFCFGALFLSLESFEPQYYMILLGIQLPTMLTMNYQLPTTTSAQPAERKPYRVVPPGGLGGGFAPSTLHSRPS